MLQEVFVETCWMEEAIARQQRDTRRQELEALGLECRSENLYTVDGRRVFVVVAMPMEVVPVAKVVNGEGAMRSTSASTNAPKSRPVRRVREYEER